MKKGLIGIMLILAMFFVVSCGEDTTTGKTTKDDKTVTKTVKKPEIIDHKNQAFGGDIPDWLPADIGEIEAMDKFEGKYCFKFESPKSKNLEGAKMWTNNFTAQSEIARLISTRVKQKFGGAAVGDTDMLETYMENVVQTLAKAEISGFRKYGDYWTQRRFFDASGDPEGDYYNYWVLYVIDQKKVDELIGNALDGSDKPKTEEERTARARVKELFSDGL